MRITVDKQRTELVLGALLSEYRSNNFPYNLPEAVLPQEFLPKNLERGSRDHAMFLFFLCLYMRGGIQSTVAAQMLAKLYVRRPRLFQPEYAVSFDEESIRASLERVGLNYMKNIVPGYWIENCQRLLDWWDGD